MISYIIRSGCATFKYTQNLGPLTLTEEEEKERRLEDLKSNFIDFDFLNEHIDD